MQPDLVTKCMSLNPALCCIRYLFKLNTTKETFLCSTLFHGSPMMSITSTLKTVWRNFLLTCGFFSGTAIPENGTNSCHSTLTLSGNIFHSSILRQDVPHNIRPRSCAQLSFSPFYSTVLMPGSA